MTHTGKTTSDLALQRRNVCRNPVEEQPASGHGGPKNDRANPKELRRELPSYVMIWLAKGMPMWRSAVGVASRATVGA